jgi:hypothetical protein
MNAFTLREYWLSKYEDKFQEEYKPTKKEIEPFLLRRLVKNYGPYLTLEAMDKFFSMAKKERASILLFASSKFFESYFKELIKEKDIIEYKRMISWYSIVNQDRIKMLIQRYRDYLYAISLSQEDIEEMEAILEELKSIPIKK